jgi:hypothetical protein
MTAQWKALLVSAGAMLLLCSLGGVVAGCGGGTETATIEPAPLTFEGSAEGEVKTLGKALEAGACGSGTQSPCTLDGKKIVVVDRSDILSLRELSVTLRDVGTASSLSDRFGTTKSADGIYLIFELEVLNKTQGPQLFDGNLEQVYLYLGGDEHTEDFEAENYALESSFVNRANTVLPGKPAKGDFVFDVPRKLLPDLDESGNLTILNFSDEGKAKTATQIGVIRLAE